MVSASLTSPARRCGPGCKEAQHTDLLAYTHLWPLTSPVATPTPHPPATTPAHEDFGCSGACRTIHGCLSAREATEEVCWVGGKKGKCVWFRRSSLRAGAWARTGS